MLSVELGLRFPLHPFVVAYLKHVKLAPCQLKPNSHYYLAGFLALCRSRGIAASLDQFFLSFNLCRGGHSHAGGYANLQQVPAWKLFSETPSSHKEWKEKFCYIRVAENPFPGALNNHFKRHPKVGSAALDKAGRRLIEKPEGSDKVIAIKAAASPEELYLLGFRRYRLPEDKDEKYPLIDRGYQNAGGDIMDVQAFARLSKKLAKVPKKKKEEGSSNQPLVDEVLKKAGASMVPEGEGHPKGAAVMDTVAEAGGSQAGELKRKNTGKGVMPPESKKKKKTEGTKDAPLVITEGPSPFQASESIPLEDFDEGAWPQETVQFSFKKGTAVMHGTLDPREFLRGATPPLDRSTLGRFDDEALEVKALQASVSASLAFGEYLRRMEQVRLRKAEDDKALRKLVAKNTEAIRKMAELEEALRQAGDMLEAAKAEARAEGKAEAEKAAAEASKKAADEAEKAKTEAVVKAKEDAIAAFLAEGWKSDEHQGWVDSVIEQGVGAWVKGPGSEWMALRGKDYFDGGEFFTQRLIYRKLAQHFGIPKDEFDPSVYGLPPRQPDVRIPLPEGEERVQLADSELMREYGLNGEEDAEDDASSKPRDDVAENAQV
ncbi:unnamed protein product [Cuscuta epithymum]|uniref:Transposase (putative) gypsy type domain-containing protein n=1 Tax=Cuscuta epithymum TaxID=186058 RepID=A0AAV0FBE7_9ASTE|nr:unnamed protein product [Cuscuta epithymum]